MKALLIYTILLVVLVGYVLFVTGKAVNAGLTNNARIMHQIEGR